MTTKPEPLDLAELRSLAAAATPGPWDAENDGDTISVNAGTARTKWDYVGDGIKIGNAASSWRTTDRILEHDVDDQTEAEEAQREADAEFIAATRTAVPQLIEALEAANAREAARTRDAAFPEFVPESVTDAAFESQASWWTVGAEPLQSVLVPQLIEQIAEATYRATLAAISPGDEAFEYGTAHADDLQSASLEPSREDAQARVAGWNSVDPDQKGRVVRRPKRGWEPLPGGAE